jgi:type II secretory pathway pseudopilin PulG
MLQIPIGNKKGSLIVEILVVIAIIAIALASLFGLTYFSLDASHLAGQNTQAEALAQEAMEAVRNFRDGTSWNINGLGKLATSTDYYPKATSSPFKWQLIQGQETINIFTRKVIFYSVQRDANSNIVVSGGVNDPETKKASVSVSWTEKGRPHQVSISTYFTNWRR